MFLDVEYIYQIDGIKSEGYWNINKDKGRIKFNLSLIYENCLSSIYDNIEESIIDRLILIEIMERCCIERAHEKIKIKGGRCNPCCVRNISYFMKYSLAWDKIRELNKENNK